LRGLLEVCEMRSLDALLSHPHIACIERKIVACRSCTEDNHAAALDDKARHRKRLFARMLEYDIDIALSGNLPDRLAEAARFFRPRAEFRRVYRRHLSPALVFLAVDHAFGAKVENVLDLRLIRNDPDRVGAGRGNKLDTEHAKTAGGAPHQNVVAGLEC